METVGIASAAAVLPACAEDEAGLLCDDPSLTLPTDLPSYAHSGAPGPEGLFQHGVASGDPWPDSVILWTRVTPDVTAEVEVYYEVALDTAFSRRLAAGTFRTSEARDYTVKVDVAGLYPGLTYFYRFHALGRTSPVGRTRTAPADGAHRLRFAVMSCSSLAHGYFHAYRHVAARAELDAVLHLGDYIYEYGTGEYGTVRPYEPAHEILTLADYRTRYGQYRRDPDLAEAHRQHPFIAVWDDHETADNAYDGGAANHQPEEGAWALRRAAAAQAYAEWMPFREQAGGKIYRAFSFGGLADVVMLDTRNEARSLQIGNVAEDTAERSLLGATQEAWLAETLRASTARFKLVGQQVMVGQLAFGESHTPFNLDQWDGYPAARGRLLDVLETVSDVVVLTGDIHSSWAMDVVRDPWGAYDPATGRGSVAVELVTPGVTSPGVPGAAGVGLVQAAREANPHMKFGNFSDRGYLVVDVTRSRVHADFYLLDGVLEDQGEERHGAAFEVEAGTSHIVSVSDEAPVRSGCVLAP